MAGNPSDEKLAGLLEIAREQQAFQKAVTSPSRTLGEAYLRLFPMGRYRDDVRQYVASLDPSPSPDPGPLPAPEPVVDVAAIARALQTELQRSGCYGGLVDGVWGIQSRKAISDFAKYASLSLPGNEPTDVLLNAIRPVDRRVCPLACDVRHEVQGDQCVLKTCASGQTLTQSGQCEVRRAGPVVKPRPRKTNNGNCFTFNGKRYCE